MHLHTNPNPTSFSPILSVYFLQDFSDLHVEALQVVANCLSDSESLQLIHKGGGLKRLMEFVLTPNMSEIQYNAVKCITRVAQSRKCRRSKKKILIFFSFLNYSLEVLRVLI